MSAQPLVIAGVEFSSRLFLGTGKFSSGRGDAREPRGLGHAAGDGGARADPHGRRADDILGHLDTARYRLLPNTSGTRNAREAVLAAELAREALETNWLKLEIHPDPKYLMPDPVETLEATQLLVKRGFIVLPYVHADPVLCKRLEEAGAAAVMPLGSPIGSNLGLESRAFLEIIIAQSGVPVVVDAGLGRPLPRGRRAGDGRRRGAREHGDRGGGRPGARWPRRSGWGSRPGARRARPASAGPRRGAAPRRRARPRR